MTEITARKEVIAFSRMNHFVAKPLCGGVILHKAHGADFRNDFSKVCDNREEARIYLLAQIEAVKSGGVTTYPWED